MINSQILQGILQGESIPKMADRLGTVIGMNRVSAIRNARTMTTAAENKGRQDSFKKAQDDGVIMTREWVATNDERTRAWHSDLDGVEVDIDEAWENDYGSIMYPGDPDADPANVYNCRCSIRAKVKGFKWNSEVESDISEPVVEDIETNAAESTDTFLHTTNSEAYDALIEEMNIDNVEHIEVQELSSPLSTDEIIAKIAGGDETTGSCASLSMSYIANKCGLDVTDFRGNISAAKFARIPNIRKVVATANANVIEEQVSKELSGTLKLLKNVEYDKEYLLSAGKHMTIVRRVKDVGFEYLELQSATNNGWKPISSTEVLQKRFGIRKTEKTVYGEKLKSRILLAEVDSFKPTEEFKDILGYLNTSVDKQKKGALGHAK